MVQASVPETYYYQIYQGYIPNSETTYIITQLGRCRYILTVTTGGGKKIAYSINEGKKKMLEKVQDYLFDYQPGGSPKEKRIRKENEEFRKKYGEFIWNSKPKATPIFTKAQSASLKDRIRKATNAKS